MSCPGTRGRHTGAVPVVVGLALAACADADPRASEASLRVEVAPLSLGGVAVACYDVEVRRGAERVWSRGDPHESRADGDDAAICSDDFGDGPGGGIAYVGPCDASSPTNTVTLWVDGLYDPSGVDLDDWVDPCPDGCRREVPCEPNVDTPVTFALTIMRTAKQGFFDVVVSFDDLFCSGKLDTCDADGDPLELLHASDGERHATAVLALACTGGPGADGATHIYMDDVVVDCGAGGSFTVRPSDGPGNLMRPPLPATSGALWQAAIYEGAESLACPEGAAPGSCGKRYWNVSLGVEGLPSGCRVRTRATASAGPLDPPGETPAGATWPVLTADVALTGPSGVSCQRVPLGDAGFAIGYSDPEHPESFAHELGDADEGGIETRPIARLPEGLLAYLPLDGDYADATGNGHDGSVLAPYGAPTFAEGCRGQGLSFAGGTGQMLSIADPALLTPGTTRARTIAIWARGGLGNQTGAAFISQYHNYNVPNSCFLMGMTYNQSPAHFGVLADGTSAYYHVPPPDGAERYHHYAATFESSGAVVLYVDGVARAPGTLRLCNQSPRPLTLGGLLPTEPHFFQGWLDELMIFDRALSADEIQTLVARGVDCR